jgi:RNA polymerase sigma factor (sigma-70 family)
MRTDAQLVVAAKAGDASAFGDLFDRYGDRVHTFCYSRLRNDADAADALQDTFLHAHRRIGQLVDPAKFRPWLFAIARNTIVDTARARGRHEHRRDWGPVGGRRRPTDPHTIDIAADLPGPERGITAEESATLLWEAAAALQPRDQELLELHLREGLDGSELAEAMNVEPAHVYVLVRRMKTRLSTAVGSLLVARIGRDDCHELDEILSDWDGTFSLAVRSTITRHVQGCDICHATRKAAIAWEGIAAAMPAPPAPSAVRLAVMGVVTGGTVGLGGAGPGTEAAGAQPAPGDQDLEGDTVATTDEPPSSDGGSEEATAAGHGGRRIATAVIATTLGRVAVTVGALGVVLAWPVIAGDDGPDVVTEVAGISEQAPDPNGTGGDGAPPDRADTDADADADDDPLAVDGTTNVVTTTSFVATVPTTTVVTPPGTDPAPVPAATTIPPPAPPPTRSPTTIPTPAPPPTRSPTTVPPTSPPTTTVPTTTTPTTTTPTTTTSTTSTSTTTAPPSSTTTSTTTTSTTTTTTSTTTTTIPIPTIAVAFSPAAVWTNTGACADGQTGLAVQSVATITPSAEAVIVTVTVSWDGTTRTAVAAPAGDGTWTATIGPYGAARDDLVRVDVTDDNDNTSSTTATLAVLACPG